MDTHPGVWTEFIGADWRGRKVGRVGQHTGRMCPPPQLRPNLQGVLIADPELWNTKGVLHSSQLHIPLYCILIFSRPPHPPFPHHPQDVLIQNSDRHEGHFLWAEHWAKGSYTGGRVAHDAWKGRRHPVLIDQVGVCRGEGEGTR